MKGYRTLIYNVVSAIAGSGLLLFLAGFDWEGAGLSPQWAVVIGGVAVILDKLVNIGLRLATTTPVGKQ